MNHEEYNGWYNYETWVTALWLQNDQGSCNYWEEMTNDVESIYDLAQMIKDEIEENDPTNDHASMYADLMSAAISEINFNEIAHHFWDDYRIKVIEKAKEEAENMIEAFEASKDDEDCIKDSFNNEQYIAVYYGNILDINPSGKYYTPWANSNVSEEEAEEDEEFWEEIERVLSEKGLWYESGEGDALDIYICGHIEGDLNEYT